MPKCRHLELENARDHVSALTRHCEFVWFCVTGGRRLSNFPKEQVPADSGSCANERCRDISLEISRDYTGAFVVTLIAQDDGGSEQGGINSTFREFVIYISSVNDAPTFVLPTCCTISVRQVRPPAEALDKIVVAKVLPAPLDEQGELVTFSLRFFDDKCPPSAFVTLPSVDAYGTMTFRAKEGDGWSCLIGVWLTDDGGSKSLVQNFTLQTYYLVINTAPMFGLASETLTVLESTLPDTAFVFPRFLADVSPGTQPEEATQKISFTVRVAARDGGIFRYPPLVSGDGDLRFEPFFGEHGRAHLFIIGSDDGGTAHGGIAVSEQMVSIVVLPLPRISSVTPALGAVHGGQQITLRGAFLSRFSLPTASRLAPIPPRGTTNECSHAVNSANGMATDHYYYYHDPRQQDAYVPTVTLGGQECVNVTVVHAGELVCLTPPWPMGAKSTVSVHLHVHEHVRDSSSGKMMERSCHPPLSASSFTYVSLFYGANSVVAYGLTSPPALTPSSAPTPAADGGSNSQGPFSGSDAPGSSSCGPRPGVDEAPLLQDTEGLSRVHTLQRAAIPLEGAVLALSEYDGLLFVGGSFGATGSDSYSKFVASWDGRVRRSLGFGVDGTVRVLLPLGPFLLVAGTFTRAYQPLSAGAGVLHTGGVALWSTNRQEWDLLGGASVAASVSAAVRNSSTLFIAGSFRSGVPAGCQGICAYTLSSDASNVTAWSAVGGGVSGGFIMTMLMVPERGLVMGGSFHSVGKPGAPSDTQEAQGSGGEARFSRGWNRGDRDSKYSYLAMWDGESWHSIGDLNGNVRALATLGEHLYVGGDFSSAGGLDVKYFARVHLNSKLWSTPAPSSSNPNAPVQSLRPIDSCLYLGGGFTTPGPFAIRYCLERNPPFEAVPGAHELGPINVMAAASQLDDVAVWTRRPKHLLCLLTSQLSESWSAVPGVCNE
jgi:hypothetical protein